MDIPPTNKVDESLPADLAACHQLIVRLRGELADARQRLAVHEQNQCRELEHRYGKGTTAADLLSFGQAMARPLSKSQRAAVKAELAAEDAERAAEEADLEARWQAARRRDKNLEQAGDFVDFSLAPAGWICYNARVMDDAAILDLPDDLALLKRMIAERDAALFGRHMQMEAMRREVARAAAALCERDAAIEQIKREAAEQLEAEKQRHKAEMAAILRRFYGPRSEAFDPTQLLLFGLAVAPDTPVDPNSDEAKAAEAESGQKLTTRRINHHKHGRRELPAHLPRHEVLHDLNAEQKPCPCCGKERLCIGSESSEQLEFVAATFKVLKHIRHKYACKPCGEGCEHCDGSPHIEIATKPAQPIEKGLPGPGLLAHIAVSKMQDHLPLYRLEQIFDRIGVDIARSTMCSWMSACGSLVQSLVDLMTRRVKQSKVIHTDDTRVPVQDDEVKGKCKSGRIWCFLGDESNPYDVFHYTPDRTRAGPQNFLADYRGHLQADAYGGYDGIYTRGNVTEVACMAHARRKFFDAKETDGRRSAQMLRFVQRLYAIEDRIKLRIGKRLKKNPELTMDQRHEITREARQARSVPILNQMKVWLDAEQKLVLPRSPIAAAITYMLNQWIALCVYTTAGFLNIDNNAAERALKRVAIGRKNWLFAGNDAAGASHANLYTLLASAQRHGLDPQKYMMSVLSKIGQTPMSELDQFLPDKWKAEDAAEPPIKGSLAPAVKDQQDSQEQAASSVGLGQNVPQRDAR